MIEINSNSQDYIKLLNSIAASFSTKIKDGFLSVPPSIGKGYLWAINLPEGISILISDASYHEEILLYRTAGSGQYFTLQFNETIGDTDKAHQWPESSISFLKNQNMVLLTNSLMSPKFIFPAGLRFRSVNMIFSKEHLQMFFDTKTINDFVSRYFSVFFKNENVDPIDTDYRLLMNELIKEKIDHPLKLHFIQNRIMLLLERFIRKFFSKMNLAEGNKRFKEEEISRLMKVEAILVQDFSKPPPVIKALSRFAAMSPTKLKTDFKALYGFPLYEYYQKNRMIYAKILLMENKYTIREVGNMVGYKNLGHFAASFKKEFGLLPRKLL